MITDALLGFVAWVVEQVSGFLPEWEVPSWVGEVGDKVQEVMTSVGSLGAWVPMEFGLTVAASVLACILIGLLIRIARIVASFLTLGGGSAG